LAWISEIGAAYVEIEAHRLAQEELRARKAGLDRFVRIQVGPESRHVVPLDFSPAISSFAGGLGAERKMVLTMAALIRLACLRRPPLKFDEADERRYMAVDAHFDSERPARLDLMLSFLAHLGSLGLEHRLESSPDVGLVLLDADGLVLASRMSRVPAPGSMSRHREWARHGRCPNCGFVTRFDGVICAHCGYGEPQR